MARILVLSHGTPFLRPAILPLRAAGHRVTLRERAESVEIERLCPDLLLAAFRDTAEAAALLGTLTQDAAACGCPLIVTGVPWEFAALLSVPRANVVLLASPFDPVMLHHAVHMFVPAPLLSHVRPRRRAIA